MSETFTLNCPGGKKKRGKTSYNPYCPDITARIRAQNCQVRGLPFTQKVSPAHSAFPVAPKSTTSISTSILEELTSLNPLVSGDIGLDLPNHSCFPEGRKATLKTYQIISYKINTKLYRNQCLGLDMVHVCAQIKNTVNSVNKHAGTCCVFTRT